MIEPSVQQTMLPRNRPTQFEAWNESEDGQILEPLPKGYYLKTRLSGRDFTSNEAHYDIFNTLCREAQILSASNFMFNSMLSKELIGHSLDAVNRVFSTVNARVITAANSHYSSTYGGPLAYSFPRVPIRWPGESPQGLKYVMKFVEALYQVPQLRSNEADSGMPSSHAAIVLKPLFRLKADIMRNHFRMEVKGEISQQELDAIFRDSNIQPPLGSSFDDQRDTISDLEAEDNLAMGNTSAHIPTRETIEEAQQGISVWTWSPSASNWATFAEILNRHEIDGPSQNFSAPFPFSTEVIGSGGNNGSPERRSNVTMPQ